ncbi:MAG: hypothetical protein AAF668_08175 [Pseudomonadota bacterium]
MPDGVSLEEKFSAFGHDGWVSADEVVALRQQVFPDGIVSREELAAVFALGEKAPDGDKEWQVFFEEVCADFFLNEETPKGYLTNEEFDLVRHFVERDGPKASHLELGILVKLLETAVATPNEMADFVADQFRKHVLDMETPAITDRDVELLRRFLYASGGHGTIGITREEAELLFDLHDATIGAPNSDAFNELFVKAISAHLMQYIGYQPVKREEALRLHAWTSDHSVNPGRFLKQMAGSIANDGLKGVFASLKPVNHWKEKNERDEIGAEIARMVEAREADWLADRIGRNGQFDEAERALLILMQSLEADLPPKLAHLIADDSIAESA